MLPTALRGQVLQGREIVKTYTILQAFFGENTLIFTCEYSMLEYASVSVKFSDLRAIFVIVVSVLWGIGHFINYVRVMSTKMIIGH